MAHLCHSKQWLFGVMAINGPLMSLGKPSVEKCVFLYDIVPQRGEGEGVGTHSKCFKVQ